MVTHHLQFDGVSPGNQKIFYDLSQNYNIFNLLRAQEIVDKIDIGNASADFKYLLEQVKIALRTADINVADADILTLIKQALGNPNYMAVSSILARKYDLANQAVGGYAVPWLMELHNIYKALEFLNNLPGSSGKAIKIFNFQ